MKSVFLAGVMLLGLAGAASAAPITAGSELSINGSDTFTATSITFTGAANVGGTSGSFSELANCNGCVTMTGSITNSSTGTLYTVNDAGLTSALSMNGGETFSFTSGSLPSLTVTGSGTLTLSGFDPTPGIFEITTQGPTGASVTFSATSVAQGQPPAIPEPSTMAVLGAGLIGLGAWRFRRGES